MIWQEDSPGDGEARVTSLHPGTLLNEDTPDGAAAAKIRQGFTTAPLTTYRGPGSRTRPYSGRTSPSW